MTDAGSPTASSPRPTSPAPPAAGRTLVKTPIGRGIVVRCLALFGWLITVGTAVALLYSRLLPQYMTSTSQVYKWFVSAGFFIQVLTFQIGLGLLVLTVLAAALRRWRLFLVDGFMTALCIGFTCGPVVTPTVVPVVGPTWRLMDMNVKYHQGDSPSLVEQVQKFRPDVITVEDPTLAWDREATAAFGDQYPHRYLMPYYGEGLEIFSRFPFTGVPARLDFDKVRRQLRIELLIDDKPLVLYVLHPYSPRTPNRIMRNRVATAGLAEDIAKDVFPVVAVGDFNFTAETPNEKLLKSIGLSDAWDQAGWGRGSTWPVLPTWTRHLPGVRIDHAFLSRQLTCVGFEHGTFDGSDHLPIVVDIGMRK